MNQACEIEGCPNGADCTQNGIAVCERCRLGFESVGLGVVRFGGRWHGVRGAAYSPEQVSAFPGLRGAS